MKPGKTGIKRIVDASFYSLDGIKAAWQNEAAFRQELLLAIPLIICAFLLPVSISERGLLIAVVFIVLIVELLNSAVEAVVDRVGSEWHELSKRAKDIGSAAVMVALLMAAIIWAMVLLPIFL